MNKYTVLLLLSFFILVNSAGCDDTQTEKSTPAEIPNIVDPGKTDIVGDEINILGRISFGGEVFGEFTEDDQFDGWIFTASQGSIVTLDNSNTGTTRQLDTTLFLYGPKDESGFYGTEPLVFDDDSGWGTHARVKDFLIQHDGEYLAVLSTYMNIDRGNYRLTLTCGNDSCLIPCDESCPSEVECSGKRCSEQDGCIDEELPASCIDEKAIIISTDELLTAEELIPETFTVKLSAEPSEHVTIWVTSSNYDEGVVFPQKLIFCAVGFEETANGCTVIDATEQPEQPHWMREIIVTVTGVNDMVIDGDIPYYVQFEVISDDSDYATITPDPIYAENLDYDTAPYFGDIQELKNDDLLLALYNHISAHTAYGYLGQNSARTIMFSTVDLHDNLIESIYTGATTILPRDSSQAYRQGFNTEHTWPQSHFDKLEPMKSDLHHIFPTDARSNSIRSSYNYGMTYNINALLSVLGNSSNGSGLKVYQVRPERRGDVARAHFYMVARYKFEPGMNFDDDSNPDNGSINSYEEAILRAWHIEDPVDDIERSRNNRIEAFQGNRNPFIDFPQLTEQIKDF
jgi:endonuclease I